MHTGKKLLAGATAAAMTAAAAIGISVSSAGTSHNVAGSSVAATAAVASSAPTTTPIKHVVVIFDENISFDHYFGTYPYAQNKPGETPFHAAANTPSVNGLNNTLQEANPNADNPVRLGPDQALTCDQNHGYTAEQSAFDSGLMDQFVQDTTGGGCTQSSNPDSSSYGPNGIVMDYYDGNTVTGLWNLAQHFSLNDNFYDTQFGPSTPGALNVISGNTHGAVAEGGSTSAIANGTMEGDVDPYFDECSNGSATPSGPGTAGGITGEMTGPNIGDLLNGKGLTWGWFQGGFAPSSFNGSQPICATSHTNIGGANVADYSPHHEPFQYYASTSNPLHLSPAKVAQVGTSAPSGVNHQYDLSWFNKAVTAGDMPSVAYLKAPEYEDGHAGYSDPIDEQRFIASEVDAIEQSPDWASTAIFITYDDSDGWYDHQMGSIIRGSQDALDTLNGPGKCGSASITNATTMDRCGVGPRLPLLTISPWAKPNFVDNTFSEQASIPAFIESNWGLGRVGGGSADAAAGTLMNAFNFRQSYGHAPAVILDPSNGTIQQTIPATPPPSPTSSSVVSSPSGASSSSSATPSAPPAGGGATSHTAVTSQVIRFPAVAWGSSVRGRRMTVAVVTRGGSNLATLLRLRVYQGRTLIGNVAGAVRNHRARFTLRRQLAAGRYVMRLTVDSGGRVEALSRTVRVR